MGAIFLSAVGINSLIVWSAAKSADSLIKTGQTQSYARNYDAALAMGAMCVIAGILYFVDFLISVAARKRFRREAY